MWTRKIIIASIATFALIASSMILASAQPTQFSVSPGDFVVSNVPPLGQPYTISQTIVVRNYENIDRVIFVTSEIPSENDVAQGYEPIPNENWVRPFPSSSIIKENSYTLVKISINIPRQENLTGQKWEVWIPVQRQPLPGEISVLTLIVKMKLETTSTLPPPPGTSLVLYVAVAIIVGAVAGALGLLISLKRRSRKGRRK
jgi:hypothetical protein